MEPTAEEEELLDSARRKIDDGQIQEAAADLRAALAVDNGRIETRMLLVQCLCDSGQFDDAHREATNLTLVAPQRPEGHAWQATIELERGRPDEAINASLQILEIDPTDPVGLTLYARSAARLGAPVESWDAIEAALTREPGSADAQYAAGDVALVLGDYETAEWHLTKSLMLDPAQDEARHALGILVAKRHEGAESTTHLTSSQVMSEQGTFAGAAPPTDGPAAGGATRPGAETPAQGPPPSTPDASARASGAVPVPEQAADADADSATAGPEEQEASGSAAGEGPSEVDTRIVVGLLVVAVVIGLVIGQVTGSIAGPIIGLALVGAILGWVFWRQRRDT